MLKNTFFKVLNSNFLSVSPNTYMYIVYVYIKYIYHKNFNMADTWYKNYSFFCSFTLDLTEIAIKLNVLSNWLKKIHNLYSFIWREEFNKKKIDGKVTTLRCPTWTNMCHPCFMTFLHNNDTLMLEQFVFKSKYSTEYQLLPVSEF